MQKLAAVALALSVAQPAAAVTFPSLTTIYVGSGVSSFETQSATAVHCSNVSGTSVNVRFLILNGSGFVAGSQSATLVNGQTFTLTTRQTTIFFENFVFTPPINVGEGVLNIEATNSAIFCSAKIIDPDATTTTGFTLPLVRVNPHPGTVE
jgi:hypothetical protein